MCVWESRRKVTGERKVSASVREGERGKGKEKRTRKWRKGQKE